MSAPFRCSIVTPTESVFDDEVTYVTFEAWDGQKGVMHGTSPFLHRMGIGSARLDFAEGGHRWYLLDGGFAQMQGDNLTLLTEHVTPAESLSLSQAQEQLTEVNARVTTAVDDREAVQRDQQRALAKVALARSAESRGGAI